MLHLLQSFVSGNTRPGETLPAGITFAIGAIAGVVTVYATMPLEYVPLFLPCYKRLREADSTRPAA